MAVTVAELQARLSADTRGFDSAIDRSEGRMTKAAGGIGRSAKVAGLALFGIGTVAVGAGAKLVGLASDAAEVDSKLDVVFGKNLPGVTKEIERFSKETGVSRYEMREQAADMGALLGPMLGSKSAAADMSLEMTKLAADLGSFNNIPTDVALEKLRAGLVGEAEPLRSLGVLLNAASVEQEAYRLGIAKTGAELTEQEKVQARASLIMQQTAQAQGDATRTADSMANQMKALKNTVSDTATDLGVKLIPIALRLVTVLRQDVIPKVQDVIGVFRDHWPEIERIIKAVFSAISTAVGAFVSTIEKHWDTIARVTTSTVNGMVTAFSAIRQAADREWPEVQISGERVMNWYRGNLQPTITSVMDALTAVWDRFGDDITRIANTAFNAVAALVRNTLNIIKAVIEGFLAVLRGDWDKAWSSLGTIVSNYLSGIATAIRAFVSIAFVAAKAIGKAIVDGIVEGIKAGADVVAQAAKDLVSVSGIDVMKKVIGAGSPSTVARDEVGKPLSQGVAQGILDARVEAYAAAEEVARGVVDKMRATLSSETGTLSSFIQRAFGARQAGQMTPAERELAVRERQATDRRLLETAGAAYHEMLSLQEEGGAKLADATKRWRETVEAYETEQLRRRADEERAALTERQWLEQQNFQTRLSNLQTYLESGHATAKKARDMILDLLGDFGIEVGDMGELLGKGFADGLRAAIPEVVQAAKDLTAAFFDAEKIGRLKTKAERDAAAKRKKSSGDRGPAPTVPAPTGGSTLDQLVAFAHSLGFSPSHNQLTGGSHTTGSLHYQGKAVDMSGSSSQMQNAFYASIQTFGSRINELFYDPIGWYINAGQRIRGAIGGHDRHVHLGLFDKGGWLAPHSKTLAINRTPYWEPVGPPRRNEGRPINITVNGVVGNSERVAHEIWMALLRIQKRNGPLGFTLT